MERNHVTIKDVARESGCSVATVSRVLNNVNMYYSNETKERVEAAVRKLNYIPNMNAKGLKENRSRNIVYLVPHMDDYYVRILNVMQKIANENGYSQVVLNSDYSEEQELRHIKHILEMRYDGVIVATGFLNKINIEETFRGIPVVFLEHHDDEDSIPTVAVDVESLCTKAVEYLYQKGNKRIAFVSAPCMFKTLTDRYEGYKKGLSNCGLEFDQSLVYFDDLYMSTDFEECKVAMEQILKDHTFDSILIMSDWAAAAAQKLSQERGERLDVIGFDNLPFTEYLTPRLCTIDQNSTQIGEQGMKMMLAILGGEKPRNVYLEGELIV